MERGRTFLFMEMNPEGLGYYPFSMACLSFSFVI
jgi:hypothetical protein